MTNATDKSSAIRNATRLIAKIASTEQRIMRALLAWPTRPGMLEALALAQEAHRDAIAAFTSAVSLQG